MSGVRSQRALGRAIILTAGLPASRQALRLGLRASQHSGNGRHRLVHWVGMPGEPHDLLTRARVCVLVGTVYVVYKSSVRWAAHFQPGGVDQGVYPAHFAWPGIGCTACFTAAHGCTLLHSQHSLVATTLRTLRTLSTAAPVWPSLTRCFWTLLGRQ